jgi:hypothetical protein
MTGPGRVKRVPGIDDHQLVGMISESDLARNLDDHQLSTVLERVFALRRLPRGSTWPEFHHSGPIGPSASAVI